MLRYVVRVKPGAKADAIGGRWHGVRGSALIIAVRAPAVGGKANEAVCRLLAEAVNVPARDVVVVRGHRGRDKLVEIEGATAETKRTLDFL